MYNRVSFIFILATFYFMHVGTSILYAQNTGLFANEDILNFTLKGEVTDLFKDRTGDPQYRAFILSYKNGVEDEISLPVRIRTRGNFRRRKGTCSHPPLLLNFSKENRRNTIFEEQDKIKLVMPCRGEQYVLQEYHIYKLYNLVTPKSFRVRLVQLVLDDPKINKRLSGPLYGFLMEEEDQMAKRNNMVSVDRSLVRPDQTELEDFLNMAVFEYLIGNTDWSVQYRQNVKLIATDSLAKPSPVPYDFDHAGLVGAPYARPAAELQLSSVRERRFRGFCINNMAHFDLVITHYNNLKDDFYAVYKNNPLLDPRYIKNALQYLDQFYATLNNPKRLKDEFQYPCREDGTGHIIIKGLRD